MLILKIAKVSQNCRHQQMHFTQCAKMYTERLQKLTLKRTLKFLFLTDFKTVETLLHKTVSRLKLQEIVLREVCSEKKTGNVNFFIETYNVLIVYQKRV